MAVECEEGGRAVTRGATLFSGGGGVEALLKQRIDFVHAVEYDPKIAAVYRANYGDHVQVASVCDVDYSLWGALDYLHASPVCKEFSQAKTGGVESENDIQTALAVVRCIEQTTPRVFTLENVGAYQHSKSYRLICRALDLAGYMWHAEVLNSADFGVPQTRRRLILRAVRDSLLPGLAASERWVGWYAAIEDLISGLPDSTFADWQERKMPGWMENTSHAWLIESKNANQEYGDGMRCEDEPATTVITDHKPSHQPKARLPGGRIVYMAPRANARFQSLPDAYVLPEKAGLACTVIGNMVPSLMMQKIVEPLL